MNFKVSGCQSSDRRNEHVKRTHRELQSLLLTCYSLPLERQRGATVNAIQVKVDFLWIRVGLHVPNN